MATASTILRDFAEASLDFLDFALPVFIPSILVFAYDSSLSLRIWLAVQDAPPELDTSLFTLPQIRPHSRGRAQTRHARSLPARFVDGFLRPIFQTKIDGGVVNLALSSLFAVGILLQTFQSYYVGLYDAGLVFRFLLYPIFIVANSKLLASLMNIVIRTALRASDGTPFIQISIRKNTETAFLFIPLIVGTLISIRAVFHDDWLCNSFTYGALLHVIVSSGIDVNRSFTKCFQSALECTTALLFLTSTLLALFDTNFVHGDGIAEFLQALADSSNAFFSGGYAAPKDAFVNKWASRLFCALFSSAVYQLLALCYRYDYHCHVTKSALALPEADLTTDDETPDNSSIGFLNMSSSRRELGDGNSQIIPRAPFAPVFTSVLYAQGLNSFEGNEVPPSSSIPVFPIPYFASALSSWALCVVGLFAAVRYYDLTTSDFQHLEIFSALLGMPAMVLSVMIVSIVGYGFMPMWKFTEQWCEGPEEFGREEQIVYMTVDEKANVF